MHNKQQQQATEKNNENGNPNRGNRTEHRLGRRKRATVHTQRMRFLLHPRRTALSSTSKLLGNNRRGNKAPPQPDSYYVVATSSIAPAPQSAVTPSANTASRRRQLRQGSQQQQRDPALTHSTARNINRDGNSNDSKNNNKVDSRSSPKLMRSWGQQCSPACGCVVRFEATYDATSRAIVSAGYRAKSLVMTKANGCGGVEQQGRNVSPTAQHLQPALTAKGRPMMTECKCKTLHHLSSAIVEHMVQQPSVGGVGGGSVVGAPVTLPKLAGSLEFDSVRSSLAFQKTVLQTQGLPDTDTHCFDVVEEALTALVKGRIPKPRKGLRDYAEALRIAHDENEEHGEHPFEEEQYSNDSDDKREMFSLQFYPGRPRREWASRHPWHHGDEEDDSQFGQFLWKHHDYRILDDRKSPAVPRPMSTLRMFDDAEERAAASGRRSAAGTRRSGMPTDWVTYVDELYYSRGNGANENEESA